MRRIVRLDRSPELSVDVFRLPYVLSDAASLGSYCIAEMSRRKLAPNSPREAAKSATPRDGSGEEGDRLTHQDRHGSVRMVDIGEKSSTRREAVARGVLKMSRPTLTAILGGKLKKGEALGAAQLAGIMAAK